MLQNWAGHIHTAHALCILEEKKNHTHTHTHTHTRACTHAPRTCTCPCTCTHPRAHTHAHTRAHACARARTHTHVKLIALPLYWLHEHASMLRYTYTGWLIMKEFHDAFCFKHFHHMVNYEGHAKRHGQCCFTQITGHSINKEIYS